MGLLNQVLHDLEQRQAHTVESDGAWHVGGSDTGPELIWSAAPQENNKRAKLLSRVILLIVVAILAYGIFLALDYYKTPLSDLFRADSQAKVENNAARQHSQAQPNKAPQQKATAKTQQSAKTSSNKSVVKSAATSGVLKKAAVKKAAAAISTAAVTSSPALASNEAESRAVTTEQEMAQLEQVKAQQVAVVDRSSVTENLYPEIKNPVMNEQQTLNPDTPGGQSKLAKTVRPLSGAQLAELSYQAGYQLLQRNQMAAGEAKLMTALNYDPRHIKAREMLIGLMVKTGRKVEAKAQLQRGLQTSPDYINFAKFYARMLWDENQTDKAVSILKQYAPAMDVDPDYYALLAATLQKQKQHQQAAQLYVKLLKLRPREGMWWVGMAISLEALGKKEEALQAYAKAAQSGNLNSRLQQYSNQRLTSLVDDGVSTGPVD